MTTSFFATADIFISANFVSFILVSLIFYIFTRLNFTVCVRFISFLSTNLNFSISISLVLLVI